MSDPRPLQDAFLRPCLEDYEEITSLFRVVRSNYERSIPVDKSFLPKTARLVQEQTRTGQIGDPTETYQLTADALERIASDDTPTTSARNC